MKILLIREEKQVMLTTGNIEGLIQNEGIVMEFLEEGVTRNSWFNQSPSPRDIANSGKYTKYVFGRGNDKVYIYNSQGVQTVVPMRYFVIPKR